MALESELIIHSDDLLPGCEYKEPYFNKIEESKIFKGKLPERVSVGELSDAYGNRYAVILNRDFCKTAEFTLSLKDNFRIYEVSKEDGVQRMLHDSKTELAFTLQPGDAVLYRFQNADEQPFVCEYEL